jgi:hypothetical protein
MLLGTGIEFQPAIFILTFSVTQLISIKFPELKFFLMRRSKRLRLHHAITGGLLALAASVGGYSLWFNIGLGGMLQDIFNHFLKVFRKRFNFKFS